MAKAATGIVKTESIELKVRHRHMGVAEIDVANSFQKSFALALQIFDESLTGLNMRMSPLRNDTMQSCLNYG